MVRGATKSFHLTVEQGRFMAAIVIKQLVWEGINIFFNFLTCFYAALPDICLTRLRLAIGNKVSSMGKFNATSIE
jgi:hypothetical protein